MFSRNSGKKKSLELTHKNLVCITGQKSAKDIKRNKHNVPSSHRLLLSLCSRKLSVILRFIFKIGLEQVFYLIPVITFYFSLIKKRNQIYSGNAEFLRKIFLCYFFFAQKPLKVFTMMYHMARLMVGAKIIT